jgi:hypothetical protein
LPRDPRARASRHRSIVVVLAIAARGLLLSLNMPTPSPLSTLSGALKIADKVTVTMEAVGNKIRLNSQSWEDLGAQ